MKRKNGEQLPFNGLGQIKYLHLHILASPFDMYFTKKNSPVLPEFIVKSCILKTNKVLIHTISAKMCRKNYAL